MPSLLKSWLFVLLLLAGPLAAQTPAHFSFGHRYWATDPDSLRRVLASQHADTARLRTLLHLADLVITTGELQRSLPEATALATRLHRPEREACRRWLAGERLLQAKAYAPALDSLQAAVTGFDRLGRPALRLLTVVRLAYNGLNQQEAKRTYYQTKLAEYRQRGDLENMAPCYHALGSYCVSRGDYNQAIGDYLQGAELYRPFYRAYYKNALVVVGGAYLEWGNYAKAQHYLQRALAVPARSLPLAFTYRTLAVVHLRLHHYPAALHAIDQSLTTPAPDAAQVPVNKAYGLVLKSQLLLGLHRGAEVGPLLQGAQHLADSLHLPLTSAYGNLELAATWAQYDEVQGQPAQAEVAWRTAYRQAQLSHSTPLRLAYLRELARFYDSRRQPGPAAAYALAAQGLADTLSAAQGALHVAQYEIEQADRTQQARLQGLRLAQVQEAARARRQRLLLFSTLAGLALLAGLGFVLWRSNRRQQRANTLLSQQKAEIQAQRDQTTQALTKLRTTQAQLIQAEKMASLGELTAGIAHEIQNPLNFVNNFSEVSAELMLELEEAQAAGDGEEVTALATDVRQNLTKITEHGQRAAGIVKGMLEHSRASSGARAPLNINALADEYLRLAYQGLRAKDKTFNADLKTDFAPGLPLVEGVGADLGRVLLNLFNNAFYAVQQHQQTGEPGYVPTVSVSTKQVGQQVELRVNDNGTGMSAAVQQKIFQPFFTTKPTGEGTGLGLSLAHDIIAQGHGGTLRVASQEGLGTTFTISLPG
ncbi:ATP-binding protein [Hymenobacter caeli]|uniref:histidine kinase n=1 Tax=Hymenobacter caeli TaxID=2735894 RepID=A0ABX2FY70_9BACT|nr:ATP-binding protein [Hymenobacter caeli]NRT21335.1 signal transduction histidine kinase [Hymenobacter caeli]